MELHLARIDIAQVFGQQLQTCLRDVAAHEFDIALADVAHLRQHPPAAENLHLQVRPSASGLQHRLDELLHRVTAVTGQASRIRRPVVAATFGGRGNMKWFMPPTPCTGSWMQAETQEPSTVRTCSSCVLT